MNLEAITFDLIRWWPEAQLRQLEASLKRARAAEPTQSKYVRALGDVRKALFARRGFDGGAR
ncbi:MAG: hypothetical protein RMA76_38265 [Deltaproteobacteria bacterium]|jgi:hypothetical protein